MGTELQQHRWPHAAVGALRRRDQRWVVENDGGWLPTPWFRRFERQLHRDACGRDSPLKQWHGDRSDPLLELAVGGLTAPFGLTRVDCRRQVDIRPEVLNVDGEVNVLRKAVNQPMGLGERGSALEGEALQELLICAKDLQGPNHPDVLLKQKGRPAGFGSSHRQGFLLILCGKSKPGLSHEPPAVPDLVH